MQWVMIVALISSTCVLTSCSNNDREADIVKIQGGRWDPQVRNLPSESLLLRLRKKAIRAAISYSHRLSMNE